jgi:hypothetical protein
MPEPKVQRRDISPADLFETLQIATYDEAARHYGVHVRTVYSWVKRPEYREHVAAIEREAWDRVSREAVSDIKLAIDTARDVARHETDPHARLGGSRLLLEQHARLSAAAEAASVSNEPDHTQDRDGLAGKVATLLEALRGPRS